MLVKNKRTINETHDQLKDRKFFFAEEGYVRNFLGIEINHHKNGNMRLLQPCLIKMTIEMVPGMMNSNPRETPAILTVALTKDANGKYLGVAD